MSVLVVTATAARIPKYRRLYGKLFLIIMHNILETSKFYNNFVHFHCNYSKNHLAAILRHIILSIWNLNSESDMADLMGLGPFSVLENQLKK